MKRRLNPLESRLRNSPTPEKFRREGANIKNRPLQKRSNRNTSPSLLSRYKKLSFWNKFAFWSSLASIISLLLFFLPSGGPSKTNADEVAKAVLNALMQQGLVPGTAQPKSSPDFQAAYLKVASLYNVSVEEAKRVVGAWVAEKQKSPDISERAEAALLAKNYSESARLSDEAAAIKLRMAGQVLETRRRFLNSATEDLQRAGLALAFDGKLQEAIARFEQGLTLVSINDFSEMWAALQNSLGICHGELGMLGTGTESIYHLEASAMAFRETAKVFSQDKFPEVWAGLQINIANTLRVLALRQTGPASARLLGEAAADYQASLESDYFKTNFQGYRSFVLENLADVLKSQAIQSEKPQAIDLFAKAAVAYREALKFKIDDKNQLAMTYGHLSEVLRIQSDLTDGSQSIQYLNEAVSALREILKIYPRDQSPKEWAETQCLIGATIYHRPFSKNVSEAVSLLSDAVASHREALMVYSRAEFPKEWAMNQSMLGNALSGLGKRSEGATANQDFAESLTAFYAALEVYTKTEFPKEYEFTVQHLHDTEGSLAALRKGKTP